MPGAQLPHTSQGTIIGGHPAHPAGVRLSRRRRDRTQRGRIGGGDVAACCLYVRLGPAGRADRADNALPAGLSVRLTKPGLLGVLASGSLDGLDHSGDPAALTRLLGHLDGGDHQFPIVTP